MENGISTAVYLVDPLRAMLLLQDLQNTYNININFFEYADICQKIKALFERGKKPIYIERMPRNNAIYLLLNFDEKGSSTFTKN